MNKQMEKYTEDMNQKANRNIDFLIDDAIETMQHRKRRKRLVSSLTTVMATFGLYVVLLNTSVSVQAYVLQHDFLKTISEPLIFNNIFEEVETQIFEDELISLEFVLNNIKDIEVSRTEVSNANPGDGLTRLNYIEGSDNNRYFVEYDPEYIGMEDRIVAIWESTDQGLVQVYTYQSDVFARSPILSVNGVIYVMDDLSQMREMDPNYDVPRTVYAVSKTQVTRVYEGKQNSGLYQFFVSNGVPYFMYLSDMNTTPKWEVVNLETNAVKTINLELDETDYFTGISVHNDTFMLSKIDYESNPICSDSALSLKMIVVQPDGTILEKSGCTSHNYKLISDSILFGQRLGSSSEQENRYHVMNLETNETFTSDNTTETYNKISNTDSMVAVMRIRTDTGVKELYMTSDASEYYTYQEINSDPQEILFTGDYNKINLVVKSPGSDVQYVYTIRRK